ncbi:hypothetical protein FBU30_007808, partial [Linnemannia zychae]
ATPEVTDGSNSSVTSPSETKPEAMHQETAESHPDDETAKNEESTSAVSADTQFESVPEKSEKAEPDPLDLIVEAALELARQSEPMDHDYMVLVH